MDFILVTWELETFLSDFRGEWIVNLRLPIR